ncbi:hypothetical protein TW80_10625 [Loktanella sp. S4079]|nr:hypothetical protein TW80_10625 [Loktanella sp. S4079]
MVSYAVKENEIDHAGKPHRHRQRWGWAPIDRPDDREIAVVAHQCAHGAVGLTLAALAERHPVQGARHGDFL